MGAPILDEKIKKYKNKLKKLDEMAKGLSDEEKIRYQSARQRYRMRLDAWKKTLGSELSIFNSNMEEGYHELESHILNKK